MNNNEPKILGHGKLQRSLSPGHQKRLFLECFDTFMGEDAEEVLPLSSPALWKQIFDAATALRTSKEPGVPRESVLLLLEVRRDPLLWDQTLQPSYTRFLRQTPPPSLTACILSIL